MATCVITGTILDASGSAVSGVEVDFNTQTPTISAEPVMASTTTNASGVFSLSLLQGLSGVVIINVRQSGMSQTTPYKFNVNIPAASSATFSSILVDN